MMSNNLILFHITTSGKQGEDLGTDETPVILITVAVFDCILSKSLIFDQYVVEINPNLPSCTRMESGQFLTEDCCAETGLDDSIFEKAQKLDVVLKNIHRVLQNNTNSGKFTVITDGQAALRLALHPQISRENIEISNYDYLFRFIDLRKEYHYFYKTDKLATLDEMVQESGILVNDKNGNYGRTECHKMLEIVRKMNDEGNQWERIENISQFYTSAIVRKTDCVNDDLVVRARGLPWQATDSDINRFFRGLNIEKGGIALVLSKVGRRNGEALIRFESREHRDMALRKHKHHMGQRYIEVYMATGRDFIQVAGGETEEAERFLKKLEKPSQTLIRMRGLPYTVTAAQILEFFATANCNVDHDEEGILFVNHCDGRATGDAFVIFGSEAEAEEALKSHRENIGNRYIELFKSTPAEVNQVMNGVMFPSPPSPPPPQPPSLTTALPLGPSFALPLPFQPHHSGHHQVAAAGTLPTLFPSHFIDEAAATVSLLNAAAAFPVGTTSNIGGHFAAAQGTGISHYANAQLPTACNDANAMTQARIFVRIKGMPLEANIADIITFLDTFQNYISFQGVHIVYNNMGQPAGEAIVQMLSESVALSVAENKNRQMFYVTSGKKSMVDVAALSGMDLHHFTGFIHSPPVAATAAAAAAAAGHLPGAAMGALGSHIPGAATAAAQIQMQNTFCLLQKNILTGPTTAGFQFNHLAYPQTFWPYLASAQSAGSILSPGVAASGQIISNNPFLNNYLCNIPTPMSLSNDDHHNFQQQQQQQQNVNGSSNQTANNSNAMSIDIAANTTTNNSNNNNNSNNSNFAHTLLSPLSSSPASAVSNHYQHYPLQTTQLQQHHHQHPQQQQQQQQQQQHTTVPVSLISPQNANVSNSNTTAIKQPTAVLITSNGFNILHSAQNPQDYAISNIPTVVMKNLPKDVMVDEILQIFEPVLKQGIYISDIKICVSQEGTPTGEAFVSFMNRNDAERSVTECANRYVRASVVDLSLY